MSRNSRGRLKKEGTVISWGCSTVEVGPGAGNMALLFGPGVTQPILRSCHIRLEKEARFDEE